MEAWDALRREVAEAKRAVDRRARELDDAKRALRALVAAELALYRAVPEAQRPPGFDTLPDNVLSRVHEFAARDRAARRSFPLVCKAWARAASRLTVDFPGDATMVRGSTLLLETGTVDLDAGSSIAPFPPATARVTSRLSPNGRTLARLFPDGTIEWTSLCRPPHHAPVTAAATSIAPTYVSRGDFFVPDVPGIAYGNGREETTIHLRSFIVVARGGGGEARVKHFERGIDIVAVSPSARQALAHKRLHHWVQPDLCLVSLADDDTFGTEHALSVPYRSSVFTVVGGGGGHILAYAQAGDDGGFAVLTASGAHAVDRRAFALARGAPSLAWTAAFRDILNAGLPRLHPRLLPDGCQHVAFAVPNRSEVRIHRTRDMRLVDAIATPCVKGWRLVDHCVDAAGRARVLMRNATLDRSRVITFPSIV